MPARGCADKRVLGLFPHPDDESYAAGGTLALCAHRGATVTVVSATRGERGGSRRPLSRPLAAVRSGELAAACRALGAAPPRFLDLPDAELAATDYRQAVARIYALLCELRPHVVVTLGRDGVYGHLDHVTCTAWLARAVQAVPETHRPRVLHTAFPRGLFAPVWRRLRRVPGVPLAPGLARGDLGMDIDNADLCVAIAAVRHAKLAAICAHASQLVAGDPATFLSRGRSSTPTQAPNQAPPHTTTPTQTPTTARSVTKSLIGQLLDYEWFTVAAGPPLPAGASDPFAAL